MRKNVPHFFQSQVLLNSTDSQSCCWCKSTDSSLPGNFSTAETPGNRVGWLRCFLGKRRGKWSVLRVGPGRSRKKLEKNIERWKPLQKMWLEWGPASGYHPTGWNQQGISKSCEAPSNAFFKTSWVWLCNKIWGWWHDIFLVNHHEPKWGKRRALRLEAMKALKQRDIIANQVLVGNHSHMACETRCGRTHPTVICSKCKFGNEHIMGNPITSATGKPKWITSIQTCTDIHSGLFSLPVYDSLRIYFSNNQSIFPYLESRSCYPPICPPTHPSFSLY